MSEGNTSLPKAEVPPQVPVPKIAAANVATPVDSATLKALEHTGLPPSLLRWKPRLPSRNWSIFLTLVGGISYAYYYDRSECKRLKQEYTDKVKHLSEEPIEGGALGHGRKVTIYASKWPEDDEWERGLQYFKRYIKPVLVAAAIDYEMVSCPQYGSLARHVSDHILIQRRQELSTKYNLSPPLEPPTLNLMAGAPGQLSPEEKERRRVEGGAIVIGRNTLKEYMAGLRKGYMEGIKRETREKVVEREIEGDGIFETKEELEARRMEFEENARKLAQGQIVTPPATAPPKLGGLSFMNRPTPVTPTPPTLPLPTITDQESLIPSHAHLPPSPLPEQPCMLLVPWTNHLGFKQIPYMIWDLFNERAKYRIGGEAGMRLVFGHKREFIGKDKEQGFRSAQGSEGGEKMLQDLAGQAQSLNNDFNGSAITTTTTTTTTTGAPSDLDFDLESEDYYKKGFGETLSKITKARESYYTELKTRLQTARDLANGVREATTEEQTKPPPTETELREERLKRELRWRNEELGYEIVHKGSDVSWTPRWDGWLKVYDDVTSGDIPVPASKTQEANW